MGVTLPLTAEGQKRGKNGGNKRIEEEGLKGGKSYGSKMGQCGTECMNQKED